MANDLIIVDWIEPRKKIVDYLCHLYNIPETVPYWEYYKIPHYYKLITNHCILNINDKSKFLFNINELIFIEELFDDDKDLFYNKSSNLQELFLYLLHYLAGFIPTSEDNVYILHEMNYDLIMVKVHTICKEADTLVFNH